MTIRKLAILAVCVVLTAVVGTTVAVRVFDATAAPDGAAHASAVGTYAFVTADAVVVMQGDREVVTVPRLSEPTDSHEYRVVWTHDGRFLAFYSDVQVRQDESEDTELIAVDAATGMVRRLPCAHCDGMAAVHDSSILVRVSSGSADVDEKYQIIALGDDPPTTTETGFGNTPSGEFLVSSPTHVMTNRYVNGAEQLIITAVDGDTAQSLGRFESNAYMPAAVSGGPAEAVRFAVAFRTNPGLCGPFPILLFRPDGARGNTDLSTAAPLGWKKYEYGVEVADLWWDLDGRFHATMAPTDCRTPASDGGSRLTRPPMKPFRLEGSTWVAEGDQPVTMARRLDGTTSVVLVEHDCITTRPTDGSALDFCNTGTLYRETGGTRVPLRDDVLSISAPPRP